MCKEDIRLGYQKTYSVQTIAGLTGLTLTNFQGARPGRLAIIASLQVGNAIVAALEVNVGVMADGVFVPLMTLATAALTQVVRVEDYGQLIFGQIAAETGSTIGNTVVVTEVYFPMGLEAA